MNRREYLGILGGSFALLGLPIPIFAQSGNLKLITKKIPSSGIMLPVIGMGSWISFNVGSVPKLRDARVEVLKEFFNNGGGLVDSSPMYGSSEEVIGYGLKKLGYPKSLFSATKIWTSSSKEGIEQVKQSEKLWGLKNLDLFQIHNLDGWEEHIKTLTKMKAEGQVKHVGITTSHGRRHDDFEKIMKNYPLDFIQISYSINEREVEKRLLPLAQERNIAVIANRPFDGGRLFNKVKGKALPSWSKDFDCQNWAQFFLKFVVSHPAMTCAIPATSNVDHMKENMGACKGRLPDAVTREKMIQYMASL